VFVADETASVAATQSSHHWCCSALNHTRIKSVYMNIVSH